MTNKEWLMDLPADEYCKQMAIYNFTCRGCIYWRHGIECCTSTPEETCLRGHVKWLNMEHKNDMELDYKEAPYGKEDM